MLMLVLVLAYSFLLFLRILPTGCDFFALPRLGFISKVVLFFYYVVLLLRRICYPYHCSCHCQYATVVRCRVTLMTLLLVNWRWWCSAWSRGIVICVAGIVLVIVVVMSLCGAGGKILLSLGTCFVAGVVILLRQCFCWFDVDGDAVVVGERCCCRPPLRYYLRCPLEALTAPPAG